MKRHSKTYCWTWLCDFGLCSWVEPTKERLIGTNNKPSQEAVPVRVELVPVKQSIRDLIAP
jgi:hypothetical protein